MLTRSTLTMLTSVRYSAKSGATAPLERHRPQLVAWAAEGKPLVAIHLSATGWCSVAFCLELKWALARMTFCRPWAASSTIFARCASLTLVRLERDSLVNSRSRSSVNSIAKATRNCSLPFQTQVQG